MPAKRFSLVVLGDGYTAAEHAEVPRAPRQAPEHPLEHRAVPQLPQLHQRLRGRDRLAASRASRAIRRSAQRRNTPLRHAVRRRLHQHQRARHHGAAATGTRSRAAVRANGDAGTSTRSSIIANTDTYGGIGGSLATTSGGNALGPLITPHELGHSLGGLHGRVHLQRARQAGRHIHRRRASLDSHDAARRASDMRAQQAKWFRWLGEASESGGEIGRFEGGS